MRKTIELLIAIGLLILIFSLSKEFRSLWAHP